MFSRRTTCGPSTGDFQIPVWTVRPFHSTFRGRPTLTDSSEPTVVGSIAVEARMHLMLLAPVRSGDPAAPARAGPAHSAGPAPTAATRAPGPVPGSDATRTPRTAARSGTAGAGSPDHPTAPVARPAVRAGRRSGPSRRRRTGWTG